MSSLAQHRGFITAAIARLRNTRAAKCTTVLRQCFAGVMPIPITRARVHAAFTAGFAIGMLQDGKGISIMNGLSWHRWPRSAF